jgi:hypothetical protein
MLSIGVTQLPSYSVMRDRHCFCCHPMTSESMYLPIFHLLLLKDWFLPFFFNLYNIIYHDICNLEVQFDSVFIRIDIFFKNAFPDGRIFLTLVRCLVRTLDCGPRDVSTLISDSHKNKILICTANECGHFHVGIHGLKIRSLVCLVQLNL